MRIDGQHVEIERDATVTGKGHLADRGKEAAVGSVMDGQQFACGIKCLNRCKAGRQQRRLGDIGHGVADLLGDLCQRRSAETIASLAKVDEDEGSVAKVGAQLGRERATDIGDRRTSGHDQGSGRRDLAGTAIGVLPPRAHRQRIFPHRDGDAERNRHLARCLHRVKEIGVVVGRAAGGHPVGRQLDRVDGGDRCTHEIGDRFRDRHPGRRRRVDDRQRRALAHRQGIACDALVVGETDRAVGDRHLPGADHLIAGGQTADSAIADGDQERLGSHSGHSQHAQRDLAQFES